MIVTKSENIAFGVLLAKVNLNMQIRATDCNGYSSRTFKQARYRVSGYLTCGGIPRGKPSRAWIRDITEYATKYVTKCVCVRVCVCVCVFQSVDL